MYTWGGGGRLVPDPPPPPIPVLRTGLGFVRGTCTLRTELAPGDPGCWQRWEHRVLDVCAPRVLYNTPWDFQSEKNL
eukprot:4145567-Pyramimonas_sp.AAC.1